jgi:tRNA 2-thiouridine synthesizing protein E
MAMNAQPLIDKEDYLQNLEDWSPAVAEWLAERAGIALTSEHWELIELVRAFHAAYELAPSMRPLVKLVRERLGAARGNSLYLLKLFPGNPAVQLARIAGLPRPSNCR